MKLVVIFGPQAVGKMTVGQELEKITGLKLFHNHMTIELVYLFFGYGSKKGQKLSSLLRKKIFEAVAGSDLPGLIFTYVWAFDKKSDRLYLEKLTRLFESKGAKVCFVELEADFSERLRRNRHENRLAHKPTKRNFVRSEKDLRATVKKHRLNSRVGEIKSQNYMRIDNTKISAKKTAAMIKKKFRL